MPKNTPTNYTINFNMDNETKDAITKFSEMDLKNTKCIVKEYETIIVGNEERKILVNEFISDNCMIVGG